MSPLGDIIKHSRFVFTSFETLLTFLCSLSTTLQSTALKFPWQFPLEKLLPRAPPVKRTCICTCMDRPVLTLVECLLNSSPGVIAY